MFHVIERRVWKRLLIIGFLGVLAAVFYWAAQDDALSTYTTRWQEWLFGTVGTPAGSEGRTDHDPAGPQDVAQAEAQDGDDAVPVLFGLGGTSEDPTREFDDFRYERDRADARLLEELFALLEATRGDISEEVQLAVVRLLAKANRETQAEALLRAQGLGDALVVVTESGAYVVLDREITQQEASRVGDIVARIAELPLDHITISDAVSRR